MVLEALRAMPRLVLSVKLSVANKVPLFNTNEPAVAEPGAAPKFASAAIDKVPDEIVVAPV